MENGKLFIILFFLILCLIPEFIGIFTPVYQHDDIFVKLNKLGNRFNRYNFELAISGNKNFNNCTFVGWYRYDDKFYYTNRTLEELNDACVLIRIFGKQRKFYDIKKFLEDKIIVC